MKSPNGYATVTPYLILNNAQKFIDFTEIVFGAQLKEKHMRDEKVIQHAEIKIDDCIIMIADAVGEYKPQPGSFFILVEFVDAVFQKALDHGATIVNEISNQEYGRSGGVKDPLGNTWWITTENH